MSSKELLLRASRTAENSGMAFIGGLNENFQLIIKCPFHAYSVIKKELSGAPHSPRCRFYEGSVSINDVALSQYHGTFKYVNKKGKVKKFNAAFVYPLMADYMVSPDEYAGLQTICALLKLNGYEYYDKSNRSIQSLLNCFALPAEILIDGLESAFCCISATKTQ